MTAKRVKRRGRPIKTARIEFEGDLPQYVNFAMERFEVSLYVDRVWQCYKCQRLGHHAEHCNSRARCMICAESHESRDCPQKQVRRQEQTIKCVNCKGQHTANYEGCPVYIEAKKVEKVRAEQRLSYRDAVVAVRQNNQGEASNCESQASGGNTNSTQSNKILKTLRPIVNSLQGSQAPIRETVATREMGTQTDPVSTPEDKTENLVITVVKLVLGLMNAGKDGNINDIVKETTGIEMMRENMEGEVQGGKNDSERPGLPPGAKRNNNERRPQDSSTSMEGQEPSKQIRKERKLSQESAKSEDFTPVRSKNGKVKNSKPKGKK